MDTEITKPYGCPEADGEEDAPQRWPIFVTTLVVASVSGAVWAAIFLLIRSLFEGR